MRRWRNLAVWLSMIIVLVVWKVDVFAQADFSLTGDEIANVANEICKITGSNYVTIPEFEHVNLESFGQIVMQDEDMIPYQFRYGLWAIENFSHTLSFARYSWEHNKLFCINDVSAGKVFDGDLKRIMIIHELIHAQDVQLFNLRDLVSFAGNIESLLSIFSLIEGHAIQAMPEICKKVGISEDAIKKYNDLMGQYDNNWYVYVKGADFINHVLQNTNLKIRDIFLNPPVYAEQILHPEKYLAGNFVPDQTLQNNFLTYVDSLPWYFTTLDYMSIDAFSAMISMKDLQGAILSGQGYKNGICIMQSCMMEEKPEQYVTFEEFMESITPEYRPGDNAESDSADTTYAADDDSGIAVDAWTENDGDGTEDGYTDSSIDQDGRRKLQRDENLTKSIILNISEYDNEQNANKCLDYLINSIVDKIPQVEVSPELKKHFPDVRIFFVKFIPAEDEEEVFSSLSMVIAKLKSRYMVQIGFIDIEPTPEELYQILSQIEKRLN